MPGNARLFLEKDDAVIVRAPVVLREEETQLAAQFLGRAAKGLPLRKEP